jgi:hypothetical protein
LSGWSRLALQWNGTNQNSYHFAMRDGSKVSIFHTESDGTQLNTDSAAGVVGLGADVGWQHIAAVADGTHLRVYHNGVDVSPTSPTSYDGTLWSAVGGFGVGDAADQPDANNRYVGYVDEVALWDEALDAGTLAAHYQNGSGGYFGALPASHLKGHWTFDDAGSISSLLTDTAVGDKNGTVAPGKADPIAVTGVIGGGIELQGTQAETAITAGSSADFDAESWTLSVWLKNHPEGTGWRTAAGFWSGTLFAHLGRDTGGTWGDHGGGATPSNDLIVNDEWYHVVSRRTPNGSANSLFINGVKQNVESTGAADLLGINEFVIGNKHVGAGNAFDGEMDDMSFWDDAISDEQILAMYNLSLPTAMGSPFGFNYDAAEVDMLFRIHQGQTSASVGTDQWEYADNLTAIAGVAQPGDLFEYGGITYLYLSDSGSGSGVRLVPEPGGLLLVCLGLIGLCLVKRRR